MIRVFTTLAMLTALYGCTNSNTHGEFISDPFSALNVAEDTQPRHDKEHDDNWLKAELRNTADSYKNYLISYPSGIHSEDARKRISALTLIANLKAKQTCALHENKWFYLSKECLGGYAHGTGEAKTISGLTFVGTFENGYRINGEISANNTLMYDGALKDGRPHGSGVCMNMGEPEECKYYKGKRIDVLFKQRIEFAKQTELLTQQQQMIEAKLASMSQHRQPQSPTAGDMVVSAIQRKATEKAVSLLFDQLF